MLAYNLLERMTEEHFMIKEGPSSVGLSLLLLILEAHAFVPNEYQQKLDQVNDHISDVHADEGDLCPSTDLILSCGDDICDSLFESEENCLADCLDTSLRSYNHFISCPKPYGLFVPNHIDEVQQVIRLAHAQDLRVRIVGSRHSINRQFCTDGIVISTEKLNKILGIIYEGDGSESVMVEPGVTMGELSQFLHRYDRSLGYAQLGFRLATVAGAIATGAHGSSPNHTSVISSLVRSITMINSEGEPLEYSQEDGDTFRALSANLGFLGAIVRIKLAIVPQFKLHVKVNSDDHHRLLDEGGIEREIEDCDYTIINWFPALKKYIRTCGIETQRDPEPGAENVLLHPEIPPGLIAPYKMALHYGMCSLPLNASIEALRYLLMRWKPPFIKQAFDGSVDRVHTDDVVGYSHQMMSSEFLEPVGHFFQNDWEVAIPLSQANDVMAEISRFVGDNHMHFPLVGIMLRFAPAEDKGLLAHTVSDDYFLDEEPVMLVEFPTPLPMGFTKEMERKVDHPYEELVRLLIMKYRARLHWGKNQEWALSMVVRKGGYGENLKTFQAIRRELDQDGMFLTPFAHEVGLLEQQ